MFAKKYNVGLILSFLMCNIHAMELVVVPNLKKFDDEAYFRVAQYLKLNEEKIDKTERQIWNDKLENKDPHASKVKSMYEVYGYN